MAPSVRVTCRCSEMNPTLSCAAAPVPAQLAGVDDGNGWSTPSDTPRKLSAFATPVATTMTLVGDPQAFELNGVPHW